MNTIIVSHIIIRKLESNDTGAPAIVTENMSSTTEEISLENEGWREWLVIYTTFAYLPQQRIEQK